MKRDIAIHESGHACISLAYGTSRLCEVTIIPGDGYNGRVVHMGMTTGAPAVMILLAGCVAEYLAHGIPGDPGDDLIDATRILTAYGYTGCELDDILHLLRVKVRDLLVTRWALVKSIAAALDTELELDEDTREQFKQLHDATYPIEERPQMEIRK